MKIAVINFSGNVGKSTVARHLLAPRLNNAPIIAVESINSDGTDGPAVRGEQFGEIQEHLLTVDDAVVDIGASNVEDFVNLMKSYDGSHEDFDLFVVPTVPDAKQERDTISTIAALADDIGVDRTRIRVLFNMVDPKHTVEDRFSALFNFHAAHKGFTLRRDAVMYENEIFAKIAESQQSIADVLTDPTDYKALIRETTDPEERQRLARMVSIKRLAAGVTTQLDAVFKALIK
ncbi:StbB family protein [Paraburkholderia susongensis]|uniref:StbB n=1 Tax=Paraburkholderia susongensis TaxID=1515439 RepID=A0A1X7M7W5_9BURK|nr:StbB family protein [Paraburkholderia susongensis]SMG61552.1 hypothetical protein SAMN06265784_12319 [Paraburkholderia susongensis]